MTILNKLDQYLIAEWRSAWKFWSVRINTLAVTTTALCQTASTTWASMPPDLRQAIPYVQWIGLGLFVAGLAARVVAQPTLQQSTDQNG